MLEHGKSTVDKGNVFGALLTDLWKAFDCLSHELIIAKLNPYGFNLAALKLVRVTCQKDDKELNLINLTVHEKKFSPGYRKDQFYPIFFECLFLVVKDVNFANYAHDNTIYQLGRNVDNVINDLQLSAKKLFRWFSDNQMKGNIDTCHLIMSTNNTTELKVRDSLVKTSTCEKLLSVKIDYKLTFDNHVSNLCKKANNKLRALVRATSYMTIEKRKLLMNSIFNAQLNY